MTASRRQIARAAGLVSVLFAVSRLLGLVREMVIGAQFGTSGTLDAYLAAFRLPDMIFYLVAGGTLGSAFIPTFSATLPARTIHGTSPPGGSQAASVTSVDRHDRVGYCRRGVGLAIG